MRTVPPIAAAARIVRVAPEGWIEARLLLQTERSKSNESSVSKSWHITRWVLQSLLALAFGASSAMKFNMTADDVAKQLTFVSPDQAVMLIRVVGVCEVAGMLGMILPSALRILPQLTVAAAIGMVVLMLCAAVISAQQGPMMAIAPLVFAGIAGTVAFGRTVKAVIAPK